MLDASAFAAALSRTDADVIDAVPLPDLSVPRPPRPEPRSSWERRRRWWVVQVRRELDAGLAAAERLGRRRVRLLAERANLHQRLREISRALKALPQPETNETRP